MSQLRERVSTEQEQEAIRSLEVLCDQNEYASDVVNLLLGGCSFDAPVLLSEYFRWCARNPNGDFFEFVGHCWVPEGFYSKESKFQLTLH